MGLWEAGVIIVAMSLASGIISLWIRSRYKLSYKDIKKRLNDLESSAENSSLEQRVQVLEKIVTDQQSSTLDRKISSL